VGIEKIPTDPLTATEIFAIIKGQDN